VAKLRPRRTQAERRRDSREALIAAAAEVIAERGVNNASLASIGERAGTSRALPSHHFGSKDALISEVARVAQDRFSRATVASSEQADQVFSELSAFERLRATVNTYLARFEKAGAEERALIVMWGSTFPSEASAEGMADADRRAHEGWVATLLDGAKDGSIRADLDPDATALVVTGLIRGVAAQLLSEPRLAGRILQNVDNWLSAALVP
jgi:AcrR family transcriptional regulator